MTQNIYDNPEFFTGYSQLGRSTEGLAGAAEWPALRRLLPDLNQEREQAKRLARYLHEQLNKLTSICCTPNDSVILSVFLPEAQQLKPLALTIQNEGFDIRPVMSPTVPKGSERLRLIVHTFNTLQEIDALVDAIKRHT